MEQDRTASILDDRRIKLLNFLLQKNKIPREKDFNLQELIAGLQPGELEQLFAGIPNLNLYGGILILHNHWEIF